MKYSKKQFGNFGESIVVRYLRKKDWQIITKNFRRWGGEIDIIAYDPDGDELVFVEVKTRHAINWFDLDQTLSAGQLKHIKRIAKRFMFERELEERNWRIDHIAILLDENNEIANLEHFEAV